MQKVAKMRIIHTLKYSPEAEYLKEFFEYIGLMVHDEIVQDERDFDEHLRLANDVDGVDVFLNMPYCFVAEQDIENRFYMYFSLSEKQCLVFQHGFEANEKALRLYLETKKETKKETRIETLGLLIDAIWKDDEENRIAIQKIKDCYVPKDEERDLFYILQAKRCLDETLPLGKVYETLQKKSFPSTISFSGYVKTMFLELWRMHCLLENDDNLYAAYGKINTERLLMSLFSQVRSEFGYVTEELSAIEYGGQKLQIPSYKNVAESIDILLKNSPWFKSLSILLIRLNNIFGMPNDKIYNYLIFDSKKARFPAYYSHIYYDIGCQFLTQKNKQAMLCFEKALELNPSNLQARVKLASILLEKREFELCEGIIFDHVFHIKNSSNFIQDSYRNSFSALIGCYNLMMLSLKYNWSRNRENGMQGSFMRLNSYAKLFDSAGLFETIADANEKSCQEFIAYHRYSTPVWLLFVLLKPLLNIGGTYIGFAGEDVIKRLSLWASSYND